MTSQGGEPCAGRWAGGPWPSGRARPGAVRGFTMVELVMVIVIMGVLAIVALPRLLNSSDVAARGLHDGTLAYLRYAQKTAIAKRRTVCVTFAGNNDLTLTMATTAANFSCTSQMTGPLGDSPAQLNPLTLGKPKYGAAAYSTSPTGGANPIRFDGLGQPVDSTGALLSSQTVQVAGLSVLVSGSSQAATITVEAGTGYVHDNQ